MFNHVNSKIQNHDKILDNIQQTIAVLETEGFFSVAGSAKFSKVPLTLEKAKKIDQIASRIAEEHYIPIG